MSLKPSALPGGSPATVAALRSVLGIEIVQAAMSAAYADQAAGEAATTSGEYFSVDNGDGTVTVYLRTGGGSTSQGVVNTGGMGGSATALQSAIAGTGVGQGAAMVGFLQSGVGALARAMQDKGRERMSLLDFIPPSEHDAIRAGTSTMDVSSHVATAYAAVVARGRAALYAPGGRYTIGSTVLINDRVVLYGDGDYTRFKPTITNGSPCFDIVTNTNFFVLRDLRVDTEIDFTQFTNGAINAQNCTGVRIRSTGGTFAARYMLSNVHARGCKVGWDIQGFIGSMENLWATNCETGIKGIQMNSVRCNWRLESNRKSFEVTASHGIHFDQLLDEGLGTQYGLTPATLDGCNGVTFTSPYFEGADRQVPFLSIGATAICRGISIKDVNSARTTVTAPSFSVYPIVVDNCDGLQIGGYFSSDQAHNAYSVTANTKNIVDTAVYASIAQWAHDNSTNLSQVRNHFPNPNFDLWFRGWPVLTFLGCTVSKETTIVRRGANALRLTATAGATNSSVTFILNDGILATQVRSKKLSLYAWVWIPNTAEFDPAAGGAQPFKPCVQLLSNNGGASTTTTSGNHHTARGTWNLMRVSHTMQSDATRVDCIIHLSNSNAAAAGTEYCVIDSIYLIEGDGQDALVRNGHIVDSDINCARGAGGKLVQMVTALPTDVDMSYEVGDQFWKVAPAAGASPGWICTTAGTGGTYVTKAMANLAA